MMLMKEKVIIIAANGFLGTALVHYLKGKYEVIGLVRTLIPNEAKVKYIVWDGKTLGAWSQEFEGAFAIINLAGRSVDCRYNAKNKAQIFSSRLETTTVIGHAIEVCKVKPMVWLNSASATIYRHSEHKPMTENEGEMGTGFSVEVCQQWETCFYSFKISNVRQVALRTAIVLGKRGGVMLPFRRLVTFGLGGKMGNGTQQFSWIHELDFCRSIEFLISEKKCEGSFNISSPKPVTNAVFMKTLREVYHIPFGVPSPKWLLEIGARIIKTETELILKSRFVIPEKLVDAGFEFQFPNIKNALKDLCE
jgi:uncharacterized protein